MCNYVWKALKDLTVVITRYITVKHWYCATVCSPQFVATYRVWWSITVLCNRESVNRFFWVL